MHSVIVSVALPDNRNGGLSYGVAKARNAISDVHISNDLPSVGARRLEEGTFLLPLRTAMPLLHTLLGHTQDGGFAYSLLFIDSAPEWLEYNEQGKAVTT